MDSANTDSDAPPLEMTEIKKKGGKFLDSLRRNNSSGELRKTVITGKRRSGGISAGWVDRRGGGKGGESSASHKSGSDWASSDSSGEKGNKEDGQGSSSEPWRHASHSPYDEVRRIQEECLIGPVSKEMLLVFSGSGVSEVPW